MRRNGVRCDVGVARRWIGDDARTRFPRSSTSAKPAGVGSTPSPVIDDGIFAYAIVDVAHDVEATAIQAGDLDRAARVVEIATAAAPFDVVARVDHAASTSMRQSSLIRRQSGDRRSA